MTAAAIKLAEMLELVLDGRCSLGDLLDDPSAFDGELENCFHGLQHFHADEDIRAKDAGYRDMQEGEMRRLIALLRSDATGSALRSVSFLGRFRA